MAFTFLHSTYNRVWLECSSFSSLSDIRSILKSILYLKKKKNPQKNPTLLSSSNACKTWKLFWSFLWEPWRVRSSAWDIFVSVLSMYSPGDPAHVFLADWLTAQHGSSSQSPSENVVQIQTVIFIIIPTISQQIDKCSYIAILDQLLPS